MKDTKQNVAYAPYNFVPFSNKILTYPEEWRKLLSHNSVGQKVQEKNLLLSGEIALTITADTPIYIANGAKGIEADFLTGPDGQYIIPGSSLRGMVRNCMQILGFGWVQAGEAFKDMQIFFRDVASAKNSVYKDLHTYYREALHVETKKTKENKSYSIPKDVKSGYLYCENGKYFIKPTQSSYLRVPASHEDLKVFQDCEATTKDIYYLESEGHVKAISAEQKEKFAHGILLFTGKSIGTGKKPNARYIFPDVQVDGNSIEISQEDLISYQEDFENRKNTLPDEGKFWALPKEGERKPVFYLSLDGHIYFGMTLFLRIGYRYALSQGLPVNHKTEWLLDFPRAILGYSNGADSFRSRVCFGNALVEDNTIQKRETVSVVLGGPKPSYFAGYVQDGKHYNDNSFQLRGNKQYWLHDIQENMGNGNEKMLIHMKPLPKGTKFQTVIRYKNLHLEELGLLLWCLCLEDGCYHSIGLAKPLGYGRIKVHIDALREYNWNKMYTTKGFFSDIYIDKTNCIQTYIKSYQQFAKERLQFSHNIEEYGLIKDFFFLKRTIFDSQVPEEREMCQYMTLDMYKKKKGVLKTIRSIKKEYEEVQKNKQEALQDPFEKLEQLYQKK